MTEFEKIVARTLEKEGGLVDDPADVGGITKYGISFRFLNSLPLGDADIDGSGSVDADDIRAITQDKASILYKKYFYDKLSFAPNASIRLKWKIFDIAVNMGVIAATKILQRALGVKDDGKFGPYTFEAFVNQAGNEELLLRRIAMEQMAVYAGIVRNRPSNIKFLPGWIHRALDIGKGLA